MDDIRNKILTFHTQLESDENHRYKSWEHCYKYFTGNEIDVDIACLHMSFYLASWGMYRGSSFLLWKDYLIHKKAVEHILQNKHLQKINYQASGKAHIEEIFILIDWIKNCYQNNIKSINGVARKINVTDTLATKIILGTLGCVPAYDRYFIDGLRAKGLGCSGLKPNNFLAVVRFYLENKQNFDYVNAKILENSGVNYPPMKLVDMYFWELGFEADKKSSSQANSADAKERRS
jgi:hypothetical protein